MEFSVKQIGLMENITVNLGNKLKFGSQHFEDQAYAMLGILQEDLGTSCVDSTVDVYIKWLEGK